MPKCRMAIEAGLELKRIAGLRFKPENCTLCDRREGEDSGILIVSRHHFLRCTQKWQKVSLARGFRVDRHFYAVLR